MEEIREYLRPVYDLERLVGRISYQSANPRDLIAFKSSLQMLPYIKQLLNSFDGGALAQIQEDLDPLEDLYQLVDAAIVGKFLGINALASVGASTSVVFLI